MQKNSTKNIIQQAIKELLKKNIKSPYDLMMAKKSLAKKYSISVLASSEILQGYKNLVEAGELRSRPSLEKLLRKRAIRTLSGIAPVAVLTKPYACPGKCVYCPSEKNVPQSYLSNEPAVMRAILCGYDPYKQVQLRLRSLEANGHKPAKIELIVIGGTWSVLPQKYKYWYIANCFAGANNYNTKREIKLNLSYSFDKIKKDLLKEQRRNEKAAYKIIGLTLETRPDYINTKELLEMRRLGCTRVELGVQAIDDKILNLNKRGHKVKAITEATSLLKNYGFKVTYHIMPGLPGSTPDKDLKMFKRLFNDERFQPDQIKFYPTVVTRGSLLYKWWKDKKYKPYSDKLLKNLIIKCKALVPPYVRLIRLIRDIPEESIMAGNIITNLRQVIKNEGVACACIRCREARERKFKIENLKLKIIRYKASAGEEYFISYESKNNKILYGFCRLRLPYDIKDQPEIIALKNAALIRELHVYGELVPVDNNVKAQNFASIQHAGLGKKLMQQAEKVALQHGFKKIAVIAGVGAMDYYRKLGYSLKENYMIKIYK